MTTDELIVKLLDGTISEREHSRLATMMAASPALAEEVRQLQTVEEMLADHQTERLDDTTPFLRSVEQKIAASLVAGQTASTAYSGSMPRMLFAPLLLLVGSISVYFAVPPDAVRESAAVPVFNAVPPTVDMVVPAQQTSAPAAAGQPAVQQQTVDARRPQTTHPETTPVQQQPDGSAIAHSAATTQQSVDASARINNPQANPFVDVFRKQFDQAMQKGDRIEAAVVAKQLGLLYRKAGDPATAETFLTTSLTLSRELGLQEYEAEALGELGLLARSQGKTDAARSYINNCVSLLERIESTAKAKRWKSELDNLSR